MILAVLLGTGIAAMLAHTRALTTPSRIEIQPAHPALYAGGSIRLRARLVGVDDAHAPPVSWSIVGPGTISADGVFTAAQKSSEPVLVVARAGDVSQAAEIDVKSPPGDVPVLLVACYEDATVDVRTLPDFARSGALLAPERAAGIAVDAARRIAIVAADGIAMAVNLDTMATALSAPVTGARFSGAAALAGGYFALTDNNAAKGAPGVYVFRVNASGVPAVAEKVAAGDTPEGIIAQPDGRTFYVTNVNSNEVLRYAFDGPGKTRLTGRVATGTRPFGIALDPARRLLFVTDNDTPYLSGKRSRPGLETFSLPSLRRVGATLSTGSKDALPIGAAVDSSAGRLFITNEGDADVVVYALPGLRRVATLRTGKFPWTPRVDEAAARLYVPSAHDDRVDVFDTRTLRRVAQPIATCSYPTNLAVAPRRTR